MTDEARHIGLVLKLLEEAAQEEGHTFLYRTELEARLRGLGLAASTAAMATAQRNGFVIARGQRIYLKHLEEAERVIEQSIGAFMQRQEAERS